MMTRPGLVPLGLCFVVLLAGWIGFSHLSEMRTEATLARDTAVAQAERLEQNIARYQASLSEAEAQETKTAQLWPMQGDMPPVSEAQRVVSDVIAGGGAMLLALSGSERTTIGNLEALRINVEAEADLAQWQDVMQRLAMHEPVLLVSGVELRRINRTLPGSTQPLVLFRVTVDVPFAREAS